MLFQKDNLDFLKKKINEIKLAKFSAEINSVLHLPNNVITALKVDDDGNIWFFTSYNGNYASKMDKCFYATLEFYSKGANGRLHIDGKATVIEDENYTNPFVVNKNKNNSVYNVVLIKLKILKAEYFKVRETSHPSINETIRNIFADMFYPDAHKQFDFFEGAPAEV
jgi:general stress protein 26